MTPVTETSVHTFSPDFGEEAASRGLSQMASSMQASTILTIAGDIRALQAEGIPVANMTVGDFLPAQFPIPADLAKGVQVAIQEGNTNYPPAPGLQELRAAVQQHVRRTQGLDYPIEAFTIVGGGRPSLYATYRLLVDPGDCVLFPVPSWNNHNYRDACQVRVKGIQCSPENAFQPTADLIRPHVQDARLLVLNTPQNPSGGVMPKEEVEAFGHLLVEENERRKTTGEKTFYLLFDQIYRSLVFEGYQHYSPVELVPECAPYVIHSDGISKGLCATGLRCGWVFGPPAITRKMTAFFTHIGAWSPKPVQVAVAKWLENEKGCQAWDTEMIDRVQTRLDALYHGMEELRSEGFPLHFIAPQGAVYMSVQFRLEGKVTPDGTRLTDNESIRAFLLQHAAFAVVPFRAFGVEPEDEDGWCRVSVGAVSAKEIEEAIPRLRQALQSLK